jgi:hypothetical protein
MFREMPDLGRTTLRTGLMMLSQSFSVRVVASMGYSKVFMIPVMKEIQTSFLEAFLEVRMVSV